MEEREIKETCLVLSSSDSGEADRLVTLLSSRGKIIAKMKGVKKAKAKLAFASFPFNLGEYLFVKRGRNYLVTNCNYIDNFQGLSLDINKYYAGAGLLQLSKLVLMEASDTTELFLVTIRLLRELNYTREVNIIMVLSKAILEVLNINGFKIQLDSNFDGMTKAYFDPERGVLTNEERSGIIGLGDRERDVFQYLISSKIEELDFTLKGSKNILKLLRVFFEEKIDAELSVIKKFSE